MLKAWAYLFKNKIDKELYVYISNLCGGYAVWIFCTSFQNLSITWKQIPYLYTVVCSFNTEVLGPTLNNYWQTACRILKTFYKTLNFIKKFC